jgi:hypothetical protein
LKRNRIFAFSQSISFPTCLLIEKGKIVTRVEKGSTSASLGEKLTLPVVRYAPCHITVLLLLLMCPQSSQEETSDPLQQGPSTRTGPAPSRVPSSEKKETGLRLCLDTEELLDARCSTAWEPGTERA